MKVMTCLSVFIWVLCAGMPQLFIQCLCLYAQTGEMSASLEPQVCDTRVLVGPEADEGGGTLTSGSAQNSLVCYILFDPSRVHHVVGTASAHGATLHIQKRRLARVDGCGGSQPHFRCRGGCFVGPRRRFRVVVLGVLWRAGGGVGGRRCVAGERAEGEPAAEIWGCCLGGGEEREAGQGGTRSGSSRGSA